MNPEAPAVELVPRLVDRLRHELRQYGEMLALLDQQQESVVARSADAVLQSVGAINAQMEVIHTARKERETCQRDVGAALAIAADADFQTMLPLLPTPWRPAVEALVRENNGMLVRVQQRVRQNHILLSRSVELMQRLVTSLVPATAPLTYNDTGQVQSKIPPLEPMYQAVG